MKRIAFISTLHDVPWGGSEALWSQAAPLLKARGHEVAANTRWWPQLPDAIQALQRAGVAVHARRRSTLARVKEKFAPALAAPDTNWLDAARPDLAVISLHCQNFGLEWMQACAARKIPYVVVVHAVVDHWWPGDAQQQPLARAYNEAAALFFVSHANHRQTSIQLANALSNARVIRNPFNVSYGASPAWPNDESALRLAYVGRLDPGTKGQDILLSVLAQEKWKARRIAATFFGSGPFQSSLCALRDFYEMGDRVEIGKFTQNIESIWETHHALALTSRAEGLPIVIVEAMLCGRACLVTDIAGNAELLEDNISGFVARAPKAEFVDEALERLWQSWENRTLQAIGENAAKAVRREIPPNPAEVFADEIAALL